MKRLSIALLTSLVTLSPAVAEEGADGWLDRTTISVSDSQDSDAQYEFETIQPLMQTPDTKTHTVFIQGRLAKQSDDETLNIGLGYRNLNADQTMLLGVNAFYDQTTEFEHRRASLGLEAIGQVFTARANIYSALSKKKSQTEGSVTTYQTALDGYDASLDMPVPYTPWMRLQATSYKWSALKDFKDISGYNVSLVGNLTQRIGFELGVDDNNYDGTDTSVKLQYRLSGITTNGVTASLADGAFAEDASMKRDLSKHTLDRVVRNNTVIAQTKGGVVIGRAD